MSEAPHLVWHRTPSMSPRTDVVGGYQMWHHTADAGDGWWLGVFELSESPVGHSPGLEDLIPPPPGIASMRRGRKKPSRSRERMNCSWMVTLHGQVMAKGRGAPSVMEGRLLVQRVHQVLVELGVDSGEVDMGDLFAEMALPSEDL